MMIVVIHVKSLDVATNVKIKYMISKIYVICQYINTGKMLKVIRILESYDLNQHQNLVKLARLLQ